MKSKVKDRGIIVKTYPYGESSLIIKCFTQEHGMISVIAKGIRQKPEASMLTSLGSFDLTLYEPGEGEIYLLSEFSPRNTHDFSSRMECWATAECALELFGQILIPVEETPHYYALLEVFLDYLEKQPQNGILIWWRFLLRVFIYLGIPFQTDLCSVCQARQQELRAQVVDTGGLICEACWNEDFDPQRHERLLPGASRILSLLQEIGNHIQSVVVARESAQQLNRIFAAHYQVCFHNPLKLKSMAVLEQFYLKAEARQG